MACQCIYCRAKTTGHEGEAHVLPEAVVENDLVLARGAVCDPCNQYLGELDTALATHPAIAFGIQTFALPGKTSTARVRLGTIAQSSEGGAQSLTLLPGAIDRIAKVGERRCVVLANPSPTILRRFHRALHHVAFNLLCKVAGCSEALGTEYDPVRKYIRAPRKGETWPYLHASLGPSPVDIIDIACLQSQRHVVLRFFNHAFAVDLLRTDSLRHAFKGVLPGVQWSEVPASQP